MDTTHSSLVSVLVAGFLLAAGQLHAAETPSLMWTDAKDADVDYYVAFRGAFDLERETEVEIRHVGATWFILWLDGAYLAEGPARFEINHPEYDITRMKLAAGRHVLAAQVHHEGVESRMLLVMPPFLHVRVLAGEKDVPVAWRCSRIGGYQPQIRRINPQFGWIEWCDTRQIPPDWQKPQYDDGPWAKPIPAKTKLGEMRPISIGTVRQFVHVIKPMAQGPLANVYGYLLDDPPARFLLRDTECKDVPAQGAWRRYDLGRVRLGRPRLVLDLPAGATVEFAYSEWLWKDRVTPYINLSAGASCNLDHYVARGGVQEFSPLTPKGGRFLEVHVLADPAAIKWVKEEFVERCYYDAPTGSFSCGDPLLEKIWMTGIETHRACAEDALIDNPTRERGQWTGDVVAVGMDLAAVGYGDLRILKRGLWQSGLCAREDGLIAGLCPGGPAFLPAYSAQWVTACVHYYQLTGDKSVLEDFYPFAERNFKAFEKFVTKDGLIDGLGWPFVDWGYVRNPGPADIGFNLHFLVGLQSMLQWCDLVGKSQDKPRYEALAKPVRAAIEAWLNQNMPAGREGWRKIGYHSAVLALLAGLVPPQYEKECVAYIKAHMLNCFPNKADAPRLADPETACSQLITPYFGHYAMPPLIERGEMDFVLDQYRKCWGWALEDGRTTWVEVFDTRWTHCHQWAGCPTWQLSRYCLGLHARMDLGRNHYLLKLMPGSLRRAKGTLPLPTGDGVIRVEWTREADGIRYALQTPEPIWLHVTAADGQSEIVKVDREFKRVLP